MSAPVSVFILIWKNTFILNPYFNLIWAIFGNCVYIKFPWGVLNTGFPGAAAATAAAKSLQSSLTLWDPTRLPRPWASPGKNTGVGCHLLLQCMKVKSECEVPQSCSTLRDPMDCSLPGSSIHGISQARVLEWGAIAFSEVKLPLTNFETGWI